MASSNGALFLISVLCAAWTYVQADKVIDIMSAETNIVDQNTISTWNHDIKGNEADVDFEVKAECLEGPISLDLMVYKDDQLYYQTRKEMRHPIYEIDNMNMCGGFEPATDDEDDCAIPQGVHTITSCNPKSLFENFEPGEYAIEVKLLKNDEQFIGFNYKVKVEE